jgi:hypothetical protein
MRAALVVPCMALAACMDFTTKITDPPAAQGVTNVSVTPAGGTPADGASLATIVISADKATLPSDRKIALTTTAGTFPGNAMTITLTADTAGQVRTQLRAPTAAVTAVLSITAAGITTYRDLSFLEALPTRVQLTSSEFVVKTGLANAVTVTALLQRTVGTPTPGDTLTFSATAAGAAGVGQFSVARVVATSPTVQTRFSPASLGAGPVRIYVSVARGAAAVLRDSVDVTVVP